MCLHRYMTSISCFLWLKNQGQIQELTFREHPLYLSKYISYFRTFCEHFNIFSKKFMIKKCIYFSGIHVLMYPLTRSSTMVKYNTCFQIPKQFYFCVSMLHIYTVHMFNLLQTCGFFVLYMESTPRIFRVLLVCNVDLSAFGFDLFHVHGYL